MCERPLVSIVIPTYGRPEFLQRCIDAALKQTYRNIEIIVVDDNNPDTEARLLTEQTVGAYSDNPLIKYIKHDKNRNGSAARNTGWKNSSGKYITFVDDDDVILPEKIEKQVERMESLNESWGACYTGYKVIQQGGREQHSSENRSGDCYVYALMRTMYLGSGSNLFVRKSIVDRISGYDESFQRNQDIEFLVRVLDHSKLAYINEELLCIYQNENRAKRTFAEIDWYAQFYLAKFESRINALDGKDRKKVLSVIALERCRVAFFDKEFKTGIDILRQNKVGILMVLKYLGYLAKRVITHTSYGFSG